MKTWIRSLLIIFISFGFGFLIGTIPVQKTVFPAYSQWLTSKSNADAISLSQSSRLKSGEEIAASMPEPGTLDEKLLVEKMMNYPLHFLEKAIELKTKSIEETQVKTFFSFSGNESEAKAWTSKINNAPLQSRTFKVKTNIRGGQTTYVFGGYLNYFFENGKMCWRLSGLMDIVESKQLVDVSSCENLKDLGRFQDEPYIVLPVHSNGLRDYVSHLAFPAPLLNLVPSKLLVLESESGLWREENPVDWSKVDDSERNRFVTSGIFQP